MSESLGKVGGPAAVRPFPWLCGHCRERAVVPAVVHYTLEAEHDGQIYTVHLDELEVPRCRHCGEMVFDDKANEQVNDALRREAALLSPAAIRANREALGLTRGQLAHLLGITETTLSFWEWGGQLQPQALDRLMRLCFARLNAGSAPVDEAHP